MRSSRLSSPPPIMIRVPSVIRFLGFCQMHPGRAVIRGRAHGEVWCIVRPADPAMTVDRNRTGLAVNAPERGNPGLDGALGMLRIHVLDNAGSDSYPDN